MQPLHLALPATSLASQRRQQAWKPKSFIALWHRHAHSYYLIEKNASARGFKSLCDENGTWRETPGPTYSRTTSFQNRGPRYTECTLRCLMMGPSTSIHEADSWESIIVNLWNFIAAKFGISATKKNNTYYSPQQHSHLLLEF